jgi:hypothetical protein
MDQTTIQRGQMAFVGAMAGLSFYVISQIIDNDVLGDRTLLALITFAATFFTGILAMAGPLTLRRAGLSAACLAAVASPLLFGASYRFSAADNIFNGPFPALATVVVAIVPLPFIVAAFGPGWRNYPALFSAAWTIVVRYAAAWVFVGIVWGVLFLSDTLLSIVGLTVIKDLIAIESVPFIVTGLTLGLALAVVQEMKDYVSPYLILRLLRLLLPVVLIVMVVFIVALPIQGLSGLFGTLSVAATLLAMTAAAATLITTAIDQSDAEATQSPLLARATQALALILPIPAGLSAYSIWVRVGQYGWTPDRLFAATMATLALGYGLLYAAALIKRSAWMEQIRQANIYMAIAGVAAAVLWLTPALNAERISAKNLVARYQSGATAAADLDLNKLSDYGDAGVIALETLNNLAKEPGQEALAAALVASKSEISTYGGDADPVEALAAFVAALPLQPASATADRDRLLAAQQAYELSSWLASCKTPMSDGKPGCVMVIADFSPLYPGNEAILVLRDVTGYISYEAFVQIEGAVERRSVSSIKGFLPYDEGGAELIAQMQAAPPKISPAPINQITLGDRNLIISP